jgi:hypothetical protein
VRAIANFRIIVSMVLIGVSVTTGVASAVVVEDSELGFRFELPDEFVRVTSEEKGDMVRVLRHDMGGPIADVVAAERMRGVIGRETPAVPPGSKLSFFTVRWHSFEIACGRVTEEINGVPCVVFNAQIPLKPEAVQLKIIGPMSEEPRLRLLLSSTLSTFTGATNWLTTEERWQRLAEGAGKLSGSILVVAFAIWLYRHRSKK